MYIAGFFIDIDFLYLKMLLSLPDILILLLIFQLTFVGIYLFSKKKGKSVSNKLLGCFFICIGLAMADNLLLSAGVWFKYPAGATLTNTFPFLYGPLLFLYTQSLIYKNFSISLKKLIHLLPFAIFFFISTIGYEMQPKAFKLNLLHQIGEHHVTIGLYVVALIMTVHFAVYALYALSAIKKYNILALNRYSEAQKTSLKWLSATIIFFLFLFILSLLNNLLEIAAIPAYHTPFLIAIILLLFFFVNRLNFKALNNPEIFSWVNEDDVVVDIKTASPPTLPDKTEELNALAAHMQNNKPYLNPELTVEMLAKQLRMHPKELSKLINEHLQQNFFDFVNRYRIRDAQDLLLNSPDKKITVLEILYKTGFNSKSSFNTLFKKYTGVTPTEFKNARPPAP